MNTEFKMLKIVVFLNQEGYEAFSNLIYIYTVRSIKKYKSALRQSLKTLQTKPLQFQKRTNLHACCLTPLVLKINPIQSEDGLCLAEERQQQGSKIRCVTMLWLSGAL